MKKKNHVDLRIKIRILILIHISQHSTLLLGTEVQQHLEGPAFSLTLFQALTPPPVSVVLPLPPPQQLCNWSSQLLDLFLMQLFVK